MPSGFGSSDPVIAAWRCWRDRHVIDTGHEPPSLDRVPDRWAECAAELSDDRAVSGAAGDDLDLCPLAV
jgi:hypothetical protein